MRFNLSTRALIPLLCFGLCTTPELGYALQNPQDQPLQNQSTIPQQISPNAQPVEPTPEQQQQPQLPNAPSAEQQPTTETTAPATPQQPRQQPTQPTGVAAAGKAETRGGAASRPAGVAIAGPKQHQVRSLVIKIGAIAAGAAALGAIYGLSKSSPSVPPNAAAGTQAH
jgi:hypothetical protein